MGPCTNSKTHFLSGQRSFRILCTPHGRELSAQQTEEEVRAYTDIFAAKAFCSRGRQGGGCPVFIHCLVAEEPRADGSWPPLWTWLRCRWTSAWTTSDSSFVPWLTLAWGLWGGRTIMIVQPAPRSRKLVARCDVAERNHWYRGLLK